MMSDVGLLENENGGGGKMIDVIYLGPRSDLYRGLVDQRWTLMLSVEVQKVSSLALCQTP